jgi:hypothetical protein
MKNNPGSETFDRIQRIAVVPIILGAAILAILRNDVSWALLPVAIVIGAIYLLIVLGGTRIIRNWGAKYFDR